MSPIQFQTYLCSDNRFFPPVWGGNNNSTTSWRHCCLLFDGALYVWRCIVNSFVGWWRCNQLPSRRHNSMIWSWRCRFLCYFCRVVVAMACKLVLMFIVDHLHCFGGEIKACFEASCETTLIQQRAETRRRDLTAGGSVKPERRRVTAKIWNSLCQQRCDNALMIQKLPWRWYEGALSRRRP